MDPLPSVSTVWRFRRESSSALSCRGYSSASHGLCLYRATYDSWKGVSNGRITESCRSYSFENTFTASSSRGTRLLVPGIKRRQHGESATRLSFGTISLLWGRFSLRLFEFQWEKLWADWQQLANGVLCRCLICAIRHSQARHLWVRTVCLIDGPILRALLCAIFSGRSALSGNSREERLAG